MEGYPLVSGGLEYLFGVCTRNAPAGPTEFNDWWGHDRDEEKLAFEGFVDWVFNRWKNNPGMHIYHYAAYEVSAVRRLSTRHDTRQDQVDELLRNEVFVELYQIVRKKIELVSIAIWQIRHSDDFGPIETVIQIINRSHTSKGSYQKRNNVVASLPVFWPDNDFHGSSWFGRETSYLTYKTTIPKRFIQSTKCCVSFKPYMG